MTKEECLQALEAIGDWALWDSDRTESGMWKVKDASRKEYELIEKLITEHFDNPPLSFDDLKEGMWVWDDREKLYCIIRDIFHNKNLVTGFKTSFGNSDNRIMQGMDHFEENRFYRRQKEDQQ